ncbi:hypothetical protein HDU81_002542 [Chytriomyces hyalinus]|nr:hypothetical protein HDU81_002542 [Chytriomyces hyalinus]
MGIEIEIKKRICSRQVFDNIDKALRSSPLVAFKQKRRMRDVFLDQDNKIHSWQPQFAVFRLRVADCIEPMTQERKFIATVKCKATLIDGVSRAEEHEVLFQDPLAISLLQNPSSPPIHTLENEFIETQVLKRFQLDPAVGFSIFGEYTTIRTSFDMACWRDAIFQKHGVYETPILELDETIYSFGTAFEIELETAFPATVESLLMNLLSENACAVGVTKSKKSKFINFLNGNIDSNA